VIFLDNNTGKAIKGSSSGKILRDLNSNDMFSINLNPKTYQISGSSGGNSTVKDATIQSFTSANIASLSDVIATLPLNSSYSKGMPTYSSSNTSVATVSSSGILTYVGAGTTNITIIWPGLGKRIIRVIVSVSGGQSSSQFVSFSSGSLGLSLVTAMSSYLSGKTAGSTTQNLFSSGYTRNPSIFTGSVDLTCIPYSDLTPSNTGASTGGILISKRDMLYANHYFNGAGSKVTFVDNSGNPTVMTVASNRAVSSSTDQGVATFTTDVPAGITPAKVLPSNTKSYLPQPQYGYPVVFYANNTGQLSVGDITAYSTQGSLDEIQVNKSTDSVRSLWYTPAVSGDSGSAVGMIVSGALVAVTNWHLSNQSSYSSGPQDFDFISNLNSAMAANGSPYTSTAVVLSSFGSY
jgi:hypothetical protein